MLENYSPLSLITRPNPIFERELRRSDVKFRAEVISSELMASAGVLQLIAMLLAALIFRLFDPHVPQIVVALIAPVVLQFGLSLLLDIYGSLQAVNLWQSSHQRERWDAMRLTALAESDVVQAYYALAQVKVWKATRFEVSLRLVLPGLILTLGSVCSLPLGLIVGLVVFSDFRSLGNALLFASLCGFLFSFGLAYVREPVWRLRLVTALALWSAAKTDGGISAVMISGASVLLMRLFSLFSLYAVYQGALWLAAAPLGNFTVGIVLGLYFALLALLLNPAMRLFHQRLANWLIRQTTQGIRRGE